MERSVSQKMLPSLLFPEEERISGSALASRSGMERAAAKRLWHSLGFPDVGDATPFFTPDDLAALDTVQTLIDEGVIDLEGAIRLGRLIGTASARIAEAGFAALHERGHESALQHMDLVGIVERMESILGYAWRRQLHAALVRFDLPARAGQGGLLHMELGVGFADLTGFTKYAADASLAALAMLTREFEDSVSLAISSERGRLIKLIGDGVMFVADTPDDLVCCAERVRSVCSANPGLPPVRLGLSWGELLLQNGDYFGPDVNLASRIASAVPEGTIALSCSLHSRVQSRKKWMAAELHGVKGIGDITVWADTSISASSDRGSLPAGVAIHGR